MYACFLLCWSDSGGNTPPEDHSCFLNRRSNATSLALGIFFIFGLMACSNDDTSFSTSRVNGERQLVQAGSVSVPLISGMMTESDNWFVLERDGEEYLAVLDEFQGELFIFRYGHPIEMIQRITFEKEGPNGLGGTDSYLSLVFVDLDTLLVWNNNTAQFIEFSSTGKVRKRYEQSAYYSATPYFGCHSIPWRMGSSWRWVVALYPSGPRSPDFTREPSVALMTLDREKENWSMQMIAGFPAVYNEGFWSTVALFKYIPSICMPDTTHVVVSWPLDPNVYVFDLSGELVRKKPVSSTRIPAISPMRSKSFLRRLYEGKAVQPSFDEMNEWAHTHSEYGGLFWLESDSVFVRIGNVRPSIDEWKKQPIIDFTATLFTPDLQVIGEEFFEGATHSFFISFVTKNGLHVWNVSRLEEIDEQLVFDTYSLQGDLKNSNGNVYDY